MENLAYGYETTNSDENKTSVKILPNKSKGSQTENQDILSGDSLQVYLQQIKRYKLLTREEEVELAQRILVATGLRTNWTLFRRAIWVWCRL
jgi:DNA-directed RNA polymerase sigma subunit (sigma70/sigma32)